MQIYLYLFIENVVHLLFYVFFSRKPITNNINKGCSQHNSQDSRSFRGILRSGNDTHSFTFSAFLQRKKNKHKEENMDNLLKEKIHVSASTLHHQPPYTIQQFYISSVFFFAKNKLWEDIKRVVLVLPLHCLLLRESRQMLV